MILTEYNEEEHMAALKEYYEEQIAKAVKMAVKESEKRAKDAEAKKRDIESRYKDIEAKLKIYEQRFGALNKES